MTTITLTETQLADVRELEALKVGFANGVDAAKLLMCQRIMRERNSVPLPDPKEQ